MFETSTEAINRKSMCVLLQLRQFETSSREPLDIQGGHGKNQLELADKSTYAIFKSY